MDDRPMRWLARICEAAVREHGTDWPLVRDAIQREFGALPDADRADLDEAVAAFLTTHVSPEVTASRH